MIIAHLADLHLGYRAYHRVTARGVNAREADIADAFRDTVDSVARRRPDLVLVAGDVFHSVRPSNSAIAEAFRQFSSLAERVPGVPIVMIAGNHDSPRSSDTGNILALFREIPGVQVVTEEAQRVRIDPLDTSILCLPHNALVRGEEIDLSPDPESAINILMLHGTISGSAVEGKIRYVSEYGGVTVADTDIGPEQWDYVALGHYHIATELTPNMWYAGAIERTSTNIWAEAEGAKGYLIYDTARRLASFEPVRTRAVLDLPRLSARGLSAADVDAAIEAAVASIAGGVEGKIVRLVVTDIPRHVVREINHRRIRDLKAEALHFHLDARPPEINRTVGSGAPLRRQTLQEQVESYLTSQWRPSAQDIDPARLIHLARVYLDQSGEGGE
jgi:DNA repair exonuclease SbcCD nuclease subunit